MRRPKKAGNGVIAAIFALGLIFSCFCPPKILIAVLAAWVIVLGLTCRRC